MSKHDRKMAKNRGDIPRKPQVPFFTTIGRSAGFIEPRRLFNEHFTPHSVVSAIEAKSIDMLHLAKQKNLTTKQLITVSKSFGEICAEARELVSRLRDPINFLQPGNLTVVVAWAKNRGDIGDIERGLNYLSIWGSRLPHLQEEWLKLALPENYTLPNTLAIQAVENSVRT